MRILNWTSTAALAALSLSGYSAHAEGPGAGQGVGNGGETMVCRAPDGTITSNQLLDLWEAERTMQDGGSVRINRSSLPASVQIANAVKRLRQADAEAADFLTLALATLRNTYNVVDDPRAALEQTADSHPRVKPKDTNCKKEQLAYFFPGYNRIRLDREFWENEHFTETDRAATYVHEGLYALTRGYAGATNSDGARNLVGYLFGETSHLAEIRVLVRQFMKFKTQLIPIRRTSKVQLRLHILSGSMLSTRLIDFWLGSPVDRSVDTKLWFRWTPAARPGDPVEVEMANIEIGSAGRINLPTPSIIGKQLNVLSRVSTYFSAQTIATEFLVDGKPLPQTRVETHFGDEADFHQIWTRYLFVERK